MMRNDFPKEAANLMRLFAEWLLPGQLSGRQEAAEKIARTYLQWMQEPAEPSRDAVEWLLSDIMQRVGTKCLTHQQAAEALALHRAEIDAITAERDELAVMCKRQAVTILTVQKAMKEDQG